jgi:hypothetical protein
MHMQSYKESEMGWACGRYVKNEKCIQDFGEKA